MASKFSLSFKKISEPKILEKSAIRNDIPVPKKIVLENIESLEDNVIKTDYVEPEDELIIPLITEDRNILLKKLKQKNSEKNENGEKKDVNIESLSLEERAALQLLKESKEYNEEKDNIGLKKELYAIEAVSSKTTLEDESVVTLGKVASNDDYEDIPVDSFGSAMLRGMGWKKTGGIGKHEKDIVPVDPFSQLRTLGETKSKKKQKTGNEEQTEELQLKVGSFVYIESGRKAGNYGKVQFIDPEYVIVDLAMGKGEITEVEMNLKVVSKHEYQNSSRVINKKSYDIYKAKQEEKNKSKDSDVEDDTAESLSKGIEKGDAILFQKLSNLKEKKKQMEQKEKDKEKYDKTNLIKEENITIKKERDENKDKRDYKNEKYKINVKKEDEEEASKIKDKEVCKDEQYKSKDKEYDYNLKHNKLNRDKDYLEKDRKYFDESSNKDKRKYSYKDDKEKDKSKKYKHEIQDKDYYLSKSKVKKDKYKDNMSKYKSNSNDFTIPWVQENLRVRIISKDYKAGKYYKEKVIVKSVITPEECECVTSDGRILSKLDPKWLETVIPKQDPKRILVVKGKYRTQKGKIIEVHKEQDKASIQLISNLDIVKLHFEDICEFVKL